MQRHEAVLVRVRREAVSTSVRRVSRPTKVLKLSSAIALLVATPRRYSTTYWLQHAGYLYRYVIRAHTHTLLTI